MDYPSYVMSLTKPMKSSFHTRDISFIAVMTAFIIGLNYMMLPLVNVKLMDLLVFVSGYSMGSHVGALIGCLVWLVYGTLNPFGFDLYILCTTCLCESLFGIVGGFCSRWNLDIQENLSVRDGGFWFSGLKLGVIGFLVTVIYDFFTNIASGLVAGSSIIAALILGIPFAISHEVSNLLFFTLAGTVLIKVFNNFKGGRRGR